MKRIILAIFISIITQNGFCQTITDCSTCNTIILNESELKGKSLEELSLLRNEILARNGFVFSNPRYSRYFELQKWYKPIQSNKNIKLSDIENQNIEIIQHLESKEKLKREKCLKDLQELKTALNTNDKVIIAKYLSKLQKDKNQESLINELKEALNRIDLNNIHWNKSSGLYKATIDNGFSISSYEILFGYNSFTIKSGMHSHSEIFGNFDDGYSEYMSENENQIWWVFKLTENGIVYDYCDIAG